MSDRVPKLSEAELRQLDIAADAEREGRLNKRLDALAKVIRKLEAELADERTKREHK